MSENRFTQGNLILLYCIYRGGSSDGQGLPDYVLKRVELCLETLKIISESKPDKHDTTIVVISKLESADLVKDALSKGKVDEQIIVIESGPKNIAQTIDKVLEMLKSRVNPPQIYFIGSVWQRDIFDSIGISKLKGYRVQFEGALDHRPVYEVERERRFETPRKGSEYFKKKAKSKAIDILLNYIFPEK